MGLPKQEEFAVRGAQINEAVSEVLNGTYQSAYEAAKTLGLPQSTSGSNLRHVGLGTSKRV